METRRLGILSVNLPPDRLRLQPWRYLTDLTRALREIGHDASLVVPAAESTSAIDVPVIRSGRPEDFEESRRVQALLRELKLDGGILRLSAGFLGSTKRPPPADLRPLVGAFLRPLHEGSTLLRRYLNPLMLFEGSLDLHHAAMFLSRKRGWGSVASHVRRFTFLWEADRMAGVRAGLPADRCSVVPHPFDPFFLERGPSGPTCGPGPMEGGASGQDQTDRHAQPRRGQGGPHAGGAPYGVPERLRGGVPLPLRPHWAAPRGPRGGGGGDAGGDDPRPPLPGHGGKDGSAVRGPRRPEWPREGGHRHPGGGRAGGDLARERGMDQP